MSYYETHVYDELLNNLLINESALAYINTAGVTVGVIGSTSKKTKGRRPVFADCRKVPQLWSLYAPYDFLITVYERNCDQLDDMQLRILLFHELLHIGVEQDENGMNKLYVREHDLTEFEEIIRLYGVDWSKPNAEEETV